jgi:hypothetical protein
MWYLLHTHTHTHASLYLHFTTSHSLHLLRFTPQHPLLHPHLRAWCAIARSPCCYIRATAAGDRWVVCSVAKCRCGVRESKTIHTTILNSITHITTLHYTTFHRTTLHYTLHYSKLHHTLPHIDKQLYDFLQLNDVQLSMIFMKWGMTLFCNRLQLDVVCTCEWER